MILLQNQHLNPMRFSSLNSSFMKSSTDLSSKEKRLIKTNKQRQENLQNSNVFSEKATLALRSVFTAQNCGCLPKNNAVEGVRNL